MGSKTKEIIFQIFEEFLTRVAKLEELSSVGGRLLVGFQQGLEFLRRPPINSKSALVETIIRANETERLRSYMADGCINIHDRIQNLNKSKSILNELESLMEDSATLIETASGSSSVLRIEDLCENFDQQATIDQEETSLLNLQDCGITDYAALMAFIYSMVKQDYVMQERIVTSLNLKSSSGELDGYSLMWSLRPFVNDDMMHQAWRLIIH